jgi:DNA-binding transcriptional LysR family regulator
VSPTVTADALAPAVRQALALVSDALQSAESFDPLVADRMFRIHMSDIGESEFLPALMGEVRRLAPHVCIETQQLEYAQVQNALDTGKIDLAFGYLPGVDQTRHQKLFMERYVVLARADHPVLTDRPSLRNLAHLDYVVVHQHTETSRLLDKMNLRHRIRLSTPHFMVIPAIVSETDLAVLLPLRIASKFAAAGRFRVAHPRWGVPEFVVGLHWSQRVQGDAANRWLRDLAVGLFREPASPVSVASRTPR